MSEAETEDKPQEVIIVRRGGDDEDEGHHGGVWKIAFADFMTAMMCFFLVMWLINAANEETRAAVASYFNPVRLTDRNTGPKGLEDWGKEPQTLPSSGGPSQEPAETPSEQRTSAARDVDSHAVSDERLFSDPYAILAEIAADAGTKQNISEKGAGGARDAGPATGASGGEAYRDPFAPDFWSQQVATAREAVDQSAAQAAGSPADDTDAPEDASRQPTFEKVPDAEPLSGQGAQSEQADKGEADAGVQTAKAQKPPDSGEAAAQPADRREAVAEEIRGELARAFKGDELAAGVSVTVDTDGVLISVTDDMEHGMFAIGSAVPRKELVLGMEKIGQTIGSHAGDVVIRGHTDGRPFHSKTYDNWRLSTARAQAAYYMLARSGVDEQRITKVAGFADRKLKVPADPYADANRRIEILLEVPE